MEMSGSTPDAANTHAWIQNAKQSQPDFQTHQEAAAGFDREVFRFLSWR
jgi:hypothetical protein